VKEALKEVTKKLKDKGYNIWIRPETTGRKAQFGTLEEILKLSQEIENVMPCIDFSHLHARTQANNTFEEFNDLLQMVEKALGKEGLNNMHIHFSGINYGDRGEKNHLNLRESDMNYADLLQVFKNFRIKGVVIGESPNVEVDALFLKNEFRKIKE
jgi:deoxyribonuclease-4